MKKRRILMYILFAAGNVLIWLSLYLQRTLGNPWDKLSLFLGLGLLLLTALASRLRADREQTEAFEKEEAAKEAERFTAAEGESAPDYLLLFHNPTSRIYQVFCAERAVLFHQVGGELRGIQEEKLLAKCPAPEELMSLPGKNFAIEKKDIEKLVFSTRRATSTPLPNFGVLRLYAPKRHSYILLQELSERELRQFFRSLGPRFCLDQKAQVRRETDLSLGREKKTRQDPARFRRLYILSVILLILGTVSTLGFLFLGKPYRLWSCLCLACYMAAVVLGLVFPDYFSLLRDNRESMRETKAKSIGLLGPLMASGFGPTLRSLLVFNFIPEWSVYVAGLILSLILTALFFWRLRELRGRIAALLGAWFLLLVSSLGVPAQLNALLDVHDPELIPVTIVDKHISKGSRGPDRYVLTVVSEEGEEQNLDTAREIYEEAEIGDGGSMALFRGALAMPYAEFVPEREKIGEDQESAEDSGSPAPLNTEVRGYGKQGAL